GVIDLDEGAQSRRVQGNRRLGRELRESRRLQVSGHSRPQRDSQAARCSKVTMLRFRELLAGFVVGEPLSPACRGCGSGTFLVRGEAIGGYPYMSGMVVPLR